MDDSKLPNLQRAVRRVVRIAAEPGGAIDSGTFSFAVARAEVTRVMGLKPGALDEKWKKVVKEEVNKALESLDDPSDGGGESSKSSVASPSPPPQKKSRRKPSPTPEPEPTTVIEVVDDSGAQSDMSSVYDAPPKPKANRKRKSDEGFTVKKEPAAEGKKARTKKDPNAGLSKEEARVADLKRIVFACGVRKQWSKEFENSPTSNAQIFILQQILKGLGMEGKPTLGKAKLLKEAKELATELQEVREFEATRGMSARGRTRKWHGTRGHSRQPGEEDASEEEQGAADAVMSFLQGEDSD